jgi:hypothetical protein
VGWARARRCSLSARLVAALSALATAATAQVGTAQSLGLAQGRDLPAWMTAWSPVDSHADLPRLLPSAGDALPLLLLPTPKVGLFWLAGNPGALPAEVGEEYSSFMAARSAQSGGYRRALDPGGADLTQVSALSWKPVGRRAGAIGRIVVDQELLDPGTYADQAQPYASNPFVVTDTAQSPMRRIRARLEGAAGARVGSWGLGASLGYETRDNYTREATFLRFDRQVTPAVALGITRALGDSGLTLGVHGRWAGGAETLDLLQYGDLPGRVYQLTGYEDVPARDVQSYHRRMESDEVSGGGGASGSLAGARWVVFGEAARYRQGLWGQQFTDRPGKDRWEAHVWSVGAAAQRALRSQWLVTVQGRYTALNGHGYLLTDSSEVIFRAREHSLIGSAEVRLLPTADGWTGAAVFSVVNDRRERTDTVAGISTDLQTLTPGIAVEAGRMVLKRLFVSAGLAYASYLVRGAIPEPLARGPAYQTMIAPEIEVEATPAAVTALSLSLRWQVRNGTALWLSARSESLAPTTSGLQRASGLRPDGSRTAQYVAFGISLGGASDEQ